jgi:hypothetical protein
MFIDSLKLKAQAILQLKSNPESENKLENFLTFSSAKESDREVSTLIDHLQHIFMFNWIVLIKYNGPRMRHRQPMLFFQ